PGRIGPNRLFRSVYAACDSHTKAIRVPSGDQQDPWTCASFGTATGVTLLSFKSNTINSGVGVSAAFLYIVPRKNFPSGENRSSPGVDSPSLVRGTNSPPAAGSRPSR